MDTFLMKVLTDRVYMRQVKSITDRFQNALNALRWGSVCIRDRKLIAEYIGFFKQIQRHEKDVFRIFTLRDICWMNIAYVMYQLEFSETPREFNGQFTSAVLEWTLSRRENPIFDVYPEMLAKTLVLRGIVGLRFAKNPSEALANFDEALGIIKRRILSVLINTEFLADVYKYRAMALVQLGKFSEAEASDMERLQLIEKHSKYMGTDQAFVHRDPFDL